MEVKVKIFEAEPLEVEKDEVKLVLLGPQEKFMARVNKLKEKALSDQKSQEIQENRKAYHEGLRVLAAKWFLIDSPLSLPKEELSALEFLVYKRAMKHLKIWLTLNAVSVAVGLLGIPTLALPYAIATLFVGLCGFAFTNIFYFDSTGRTPIGKYVSKFLSGRSFFKKQGCLTEESQGNTLEIANKFEKGGE